MKEDKAKKNINEEKGIISDENKVNKSFFLYFISKRYKFFLQKSSIKIKMIDKLF